MAFDWGGGIGGAMSGAATGTAIAPGIGTGIGAVLGLVGGGLSGGSTPTYQPTGPQLDAMAFGQQQLRPTKDKSKADIALFQNLLRSGNRGAAEAVFEGLAGRYVDGPYYKKLRKSYKRPIDYNTDPYEATAKQAYESQGLNINPTDFSRYVELAKSQGARSTQAFGDVIKQDMISRGLVATPKQEEMAYMFGQSARDPNTGKILDLYRPVDPEFISKTVGALTSSLRPGSASNPAALFS